MTEYTPSSLPAEERSEDARVGEVLRKAREAASYSVAYVAAQTHLKEEVIIALENEQYDQLPSDVFVRGYIRSYAKLLDIDLQHVTDGGSKDSAIEKVVPQIKKTKKINSFGVDPVVIWSSVTVMALLVGLLTTWWIHQGESDPMQLASAAEQFDNPFPVSGVSEAPKQGREQGQSDINSSHLVGLGNVDPKNISDTQNAMPEVLDDEKVLSEARAEVQIVPAIIEAPISGGEIDKVRITVKYTQESWTEIFDARKRRLLHGLIKPGATRVISGQAPFNVFLGNSPGVELEINGKPFDHSVYMRRNNTARFLIDDINS